MNIAPSVHWFADWAEQTAPASNDFFATPATVGGTAFVQTNLNGSAAAGKPLGIRVQAPLSAATASTLFNTHYMPGDKAISYIFADFGTGSPATNVSNTMTLVNQVRGSTWSKNAYVGDAGLAPESSNQWSTRRGALPYTQAQYNSSGANMANEMLYPGQADYRNKSSGDWGNTNIRTGLFLGPIGRMTNVQTLLDASTYKGSQNYLTTLGTSFHKNIPYVTRFNNWGNIKLDTDNNPNNGYKFIPGAALPSAGMSAAQTANQMMGRGDFSADVLHYRMRGAYSVNLLADPGPNGGGAVGYSDADARQDVRDGWYGGGAVSNVGPLGPIAHANNIFAKPDSNRATMDFNPIVDGSTGNTGTRAEVTGTIWSGVYSLSLKQLDILGSNLDTVNHLVKFGTVDCYDVFTARKNFGTVSNPIWASYDITNNPINLGRNSLIEAGMHRLLEFDLVTSRIYSNSTYTGNFRTCTIWLLNQNYTVFTNNNRNDVGIPEPTTFGILAVAGSMGMICRRNRNKQQKA